MLDPSFMITSEQVIYICGLIAALWGLWKIVQEVRKPNNDLKTTVEKHTQILMDDENRLKDYEDTTQMILKCLLVIINHEITGNGIEKMKKTRDELQEFLIDK